MPVFDLVVVLEQAAFWRTGSAGSVLVVGSTMTWTHKQARLWKPANRASEVSTIHGKHLEILVIDIPDPAGNVPGIAVPCIDHRVAIGGESSLSRGKLLQLSQREP